MGLAGVAGILGGLILSFAQPNLFGASVLTVVQGGSGAATLTGCLTGNGTSPITGSGTCATFGWPFTVTSYGVSTSTTVGFTQGILSTASSTFTSAFRLSSLSNGGLGINNGLVYSGATTTYSSPLVYTSGAVTCPTCSTFAYLFPSNATTTVLTLSNGASIAKLTNLTSNGFVKTSGSDGTLSIDTTTYASFAYPFTAITNFGSTFAAGTTSQMYINNAGFPSFYAVNASSTALSATTVAFGGSATTSITAAGAMTGQDSNNAYTGIVSPTKRIIMPSGTTTTWTASTTGTVFSPFVVMDFSGTVKKATCLTDASFLGVNTVVNGSNASPSYFVASTTGGTITYTAGNTFTTGQKIQINYGTTTTASTVQVSCTLDVVQTS